jgi:prophage tail gpP-like protein
MSKTCDLVDCAAIYKSGAWKDADLLTIASDLCDPFDIGVEMNGTAPAKFRRFSIQEGETAFEAIARAAKMRGFLTLTADNGELLLSRVGSKKTRTVLEYGKNVLRGTRKGSWKDRFSSYTVKTQAAGSNDFYGQNASAIKRTVTDERIDRYRPTIIMAENEDTGNELRDRAQWECNTRAGKGRRVIYRVHGWRDDASTLWEPNTLVKVKDSRFELDTELLIAVVTFEKTLEDGTNTTLELTDKAAYDVQPLPPAKAKGGGLNDFYLGEN